MKNKDEEVKNMKMIRKLLKKFKIISLVVKYYYYHYLLFYVVIFYVLIKKYVNIQFYQNIEYTFVLINPLQWKKQKIII